MATQTDPSEIVPPVGMAGLYSLKAPYTALVREQIEYTCTKVTSLMGAIAAGEDPYADVYQPAGDTQENYDADLALNRCLITLQSSLGDSVVFPSSAMNGLPNADGVRYISAVLGVSLSALPEDFDLTDLKADISDMVFEKIGVRSTVYGSTIGGTMILSHDTHEGIEAARLANVVLVPSNMARVKQLELEKTALQAQLAQLQDWVIANLPPPTPPGP